MLLALLLFDTHFDAGSGAATPIHETLAWRPFVCWPCMAYFLGLRIAPYHSQ